MSETEKKYTHVSEEILRRIFAVYDSLQIFPSSALPSILEQKANTSSGGGSGWDDYDFSSQNTRFYDFSDSCKVSTAVVIFPLMVHMIAYDRFVVSTEENIGKKNEEDSVQEVMHKLQEKNLRFTHIVRSNERDTDRGSSYLKADIYEVENDE